MLQASPGSYSTPPDSRLRRQSSTNGRQDGGAYASPAYSLDSEPDNGEYDNKGKALSGGKSPLRASQQSLELRFRKFWRSLTTDSRQIMAYLGLNCAYLCTEFVYGVTSGRLALVSDAFHLGFGSCVIFTSLLATFAARQPPDETFSYGYHRAEVLAAFTNCCFLLFMAFSLCVEALHTMIEAEEEHRHYLTPSAIANLLVNLVGVIMFRRYARREFTYQCSQDMNLHGIFLNVAADSIRSGGVILSLWLLSLGVEYAEALVAASVAAIVLFITTPLLKSASTVLLQGTPDGVSRAVLQKCLQEAGTCEGLVESREPHFWALQPGSLVGSLQVRVRPGAQEQAVLRHVHSVFDAKLGAADLTVQVEVDPGALR